VRNPNVPESLDGWAMLHRMFRFERRRYDKLAACRREEIAREATAFLEPLHASEKADVSLTQMLGHKCDVMLTHYARTWDELAAVQMRFDKTELAEYFLPTTSYVSILELGLYDASAKMYAELQQRALKPHSPEWNAAFDELLREQKSQPRNAARLWAKVPSRRYACFYPMDKKRGENVNWYMLAYADRARLMLDHGKIGRSFHGLVTQVISGSIGFDDFEWGVDLYADDPAVFKKLIAEMRFDEASAKYAKFGPFYTGVQFSIAELAVFLDGLRVPELVKSHP
jgi:hydrogen peroxide-dependent heme synthase